MLIVPLREIGEAIMAEVGRQAELYGKWLTANCYFQLCSIGII